MTYPVDPFGEPSEEGMGGVSARSEVGVGEHKAPQDQASEFEAYRTAEGARAAPPIAIEDADSLGSAFKAARFASVSVRPAHASSGSVNTTAGIAAGSKTTSSP